MVLTLIQTEACTCEVTKNISVVTILLVRDSLPCHGGVVGFLFELGRFLSQHLEEGQVVLVMDHCYLSRSSSDEPPHLLLVVLIGDFEPPSKTVSGRDDL